MPSVVKSGHRVRAFGVGALLAVSAVLTAGCAPVAEAVQEAVKTPQQKLLDATATSSTAPYTYTIVKNGDPAHTLNASGSVNPAGKAYEIKVVARPVEHPDASATVEYRIVDQTVWMKVKLEGGDDLVFPELPDKWMLIDRAKVKSNNVPSGFREADVDPAQLSALLTTTNGVTEGAGGKFSGTFDLTQQPDMDFIEAATRTALGEKAKALPFTATVTDGKVAEFVLPVPATSVSKAQTYTVNYTGFGAVTPVAAPSAAQTAKTPDALYEYLAG